MVALALTGAYLTPSLPVRGKASLIERALTYLRANANFGRTLTYQALNEARGDSDFECADRLGNIFDLLLSKICECNWMLSQVITYPPRYANSARLRE